MAWYSDSEGVASGSFAVSTGYTEAATLGHVMVVHASDGTRIACGLLNIVPPMSDADRRSPCGSRRAIGGMKTTPDHLWMHARLVSVLA